MIQGVSEITFDAHADERGALVAIENGKNLPFDMSRIYYIYNADSGMVRGKHAHKDLNQVLLCLNGSCDILIDNGSERETVHLDRPDRGIYIHGFVWREMMNFSDGCVLMAIVDRGYDPADYVFDYNEVKNYAERNKK